MTAMPLQAISLLLHAYVGWRLVPALGSVAAAALLAVVLVVSALTLPFGRGARRGSGRRFASALAWIGLVCMGLFSSLFVLTLVRDFALLAGAAIEALRPGAFAFPPFVVGSARAAAIGAALVTLWGFANARRTARVVRVDVPIAGLAAPLDGFTIAQVSDVHVGPTIKRPFVEAIVATVNRLDVDLVAVTGDLVDGSVRDLAEHVAPLAGLRSKEGSFFVTGNHEYYSGGAAGAAAWAGELRRLGITVLMNEHAVVRRGDARLVVAGVTDFGAGHFDRRQASDPAAALAGSPAGAARLLLAHQPRSAAAAEAAGFDLQLSGHTHGGQFLPWNFLVRLQQPFTAGLHRWRRMWVYTSRGTGYWGPPKRFGAPSEITLLRLVAVAAAAPREAAAP
ncbi:MAG: metallophosphoesterase, partial [Pseudomonadota bacterium]|nr:metallophosphoesterase [Pseudomonadota bacterium]